jgi:hypothetical protein
MFDEGEALHMIDARFRAFATGVAVVAALGTLSACNGKSGDSASGGSAKGGNAPVSALAALKLAATKTDQADSAKVDASTQASGVSTTMTGAMDWSSGGTTGDFTMKMGGSQAAALKQLGSDGNIQALYTPDAMYMNMGPGMAKSDGGKPWVKYDYDTMAKTMGASGSALKEEMQNNNPTLSVKMLIASGAVTSVGSESVRGVTAKHYAGTVKVSQLLGAQSGLDAKTSGQLQTMLKQQGITTEHIDVWVNGQGLLVKQVEKATATSGAINSTAYYSDYGVKVSVTPPPAGQTMDVAQLSQS